MSTKIIEYKEIFETDKNTIAKIEPVLAKFKAEFSVPDEKFYNIMIAVSEAINNALNHGNKFDPLKKVHFELYADADKIIVKVRDEGEGFDPEDVADCTDPANLLKSSVQVSSLLGKRGEGRFRSVWSLPLSTSHVDFLLSFILLSRLLT